MRIGIDCRLSGPKHAGIGRYILQLVSALYHQHPEVEWVLFFADSSQKLLLRQACPQATLVHVPIRHYTFDEQRRLPGIFQRQRLDILHVPHFNAPLLYSGKLVLTIHDLLWHEYRGAHVTTLSPGMYWFKYILYRVVVRLNSQKAQAILVPSQTVKRTLIKLFPSTKSKITVTPEAVTLPPRAQSVPQLPKKYWLYVGSLYPHKNVQVVLKALQLRPEETLVIVSSRSVFSNQLLQLAQDLGVGTQIRFLPQISDEELVFLYSQATVLIQPSLSEGFGLTGLEAMSAGCLVVCSDIPIFHEVYGDAAEYFSPLEPLALLSAIATLDRNADHWKQLGQQCILRYSWAQTAQKTWHAYQQVVSAPKSHA